MAFNLLWLQSGGCGGCSMSLLNASTPDFGALFEAAGIRLLWHPSLSLESGDEVCRLVDDCVAGRTRLDALCLEGALLRGRRSGSRSSVPNCPAASIISVSVTQSGCVGQPAMLITGSPPRAMNSAPSKPPGRSSSYCRPQASVALAPLAAMPPQAAQEPTATTCCATAARLRTTSIIGRPVPACR